MDYYGRPDGPASCTGQIGGAPPVDLLCGGIENDLSNATTGGNVAGVPPPPPSDPDTLENKALNPLFSALDVIEPGGGHCAVHSSRNNACTVVFLHGFAADGVETANYGAEWIAAATKHFGEKGYNIVMLDYYGGACRRTESSIHSHHGKDANGAFAGKHVSQTGCSGTAIHNLETDMRHLAYHVAWWIYNNYTKQGKTVDVVAHSMGGLLIRYALGVIQDKAHTADGEEEKWPEKLLVENVVTLGTPHGGTKSGCIAYYSPDWKEGDRTKFSRQAREFCRDSGVMKELQTMPRPQGADPDGTYWMAMGSAWDWVALPIQSQFEMDADYKIVHFDRDVERNGHTYDECPAKRYSHNEYPRDNSTAKDLCIAWVYRGHEAYGKGWESWPWWNQAQHSMADAFTHSVR